MLSWLRKRLALRGYRRKLAPALIRRYGRETHYTPAQVRKTVEALALSVDYVCYALAAFCERTAFDAHHQALGEACDWTEMRGELTASHSFDIGDHHMGHSVHADHRHHDPHDHHDTGHHHHGGHHDT
ncbi:hypothetical protein BH09MYX1_BH09MYX1_41290 [soil metagenome]